MRSFAYHEFSYARRSRSLLRWRCLVGASVVVGVESALKPTEALHLLFHGLVGGAS